MLRPTSAGRAWIPVETSDPPNEQVGVAHKTFGSFFQKPNVFVYVHILPLLFGQTIFLEGRHFGALGLQHLMLGWPAIGGTKICHDLFFP